MGFICCEQGQKGLVNSKFDKGKSKDKVYAVPVL
jgi:hypothetical protein